MVIHDNQVERECSLLFQDATYGILDGAHTVADRNDHGSLNGEIVLVELDLVELIGGQQHPYGLEVARARAFHLYLSRAIARIYIVELFLPRQTRICLYFCV